CPRPPSSYPTRRSSDRFGPAHVGATPQHLRRRFETGNSRGVGNEVGAFEQSQHTAGRLTDQRRDRVRRGGEIAFEQRNGRRSLRSEEHTSELQSREKLV